VTHCKNTEPTKQSELSLRAPGFGREESAFRWTGKKQVPRSSPNTRKDGVAWGPPVTRRASLMRAELVLRTPDRLCNGDVSPIIRDKCGYGERLWFLANLDHVPLGVADFKELGVAPVLNWADKHTTVCELLVPFFQLLAEEHRG
jgi:hypothetical protein